MPKGEEFSVELKKTFLDDCSAFIEHARKAEMTFRAADNFLEEELEPELIDDEEMEDNEEDDSESQDDFAQDD